MKGKVHLAAGACAGFIGGTAMLSGHSTIANVLFAGNSLTAASAMLFTGTTAVGSLFPDIDIPTSKFGHCVYPVSVLINKIFGHRGLFHTPLFYLLMLAAAVVSKSFTGNAWVACVGFFFGVAIHLLQDLMTEGGIMLLFPYQKKFTLVPVPSGHMFNGICTVVLLAFCYGFWWLL